MNPLSPSEAVKDALRFFTDFQEHGSFEGVFVEGIVPTDNDGWRITLSYTIQSPTIKRIGMPGPRKRSMITIDSGGGFAGMQTVGESD